DAEERKTKGQFINEQKDKLLQILNDKRDQLEIADLNTKLENETVDITLPPAPEKQGSIHPVSHVTEELVTILADFGFEVAEGPDIENDFNNFTALNMPPHHPARQ